MVRASANIKLENHVVKNVMVPVYVNIKKTERYVKNVMDPHFVITEYLNKFEKIVMVVVSVNTKDKNIDVMNVKGRAFANTINNVIVASHAMAQEYVNIKRIKHIVRNVMGRRIVSIQNKKQDV